MVIQSRMRGVALIKAMLVVALASSVAVAMVSRQQFDIRRTGNILQAGQARLYAEGVETWAAQLLRRDRQNGEVDEREEDWATVLPPIPIEGGSVAGYIDDLQGRFNLNALVNGGKADAEAVAAFRRLLAALQVEYPEVATGLGPELADVIVDWLDEDLDVTFPGGAEDSYYLGLERPYRSANGAMLSPDELLLMKGMDAEVYKALQAHVCTLPMGLKVNVNTATLPVLMSLANGITRADTEALEQDRPYKDVAAFLAHKALAGRQVKQEIVAVGSEHFLIAAQVEYGALIQHYYSVLWRDSKGDGRILMRAQGIY